jgi:spermidine synthase
MEQVVFRGHTGGHPVLVTDEDGLRSLRFGTEERQSCLDLAKPWALQLAYTQWMVTALLLHPDPARFLVVGLGGGALLHFLLHYHPEAIIDVVEKEQLVIDIAHKYFHMPRHLGLRFFCQDVLTFLAGPPTNSYDVIFLDIFDPGAMAPALFEPTLYLALLEQLGSEGILAVNLWNGDQALYQEALSAVTSVSDGRVLQMQVKKRSNVILLVFPRDIPYAAIKQTHKKSEAYRQRYGLDFPLYLKRLRRTNRLSLLRSLFG